jgi:hypothetical protein
MSKVIEFKGANRFTQLIIQVAKELNLPVSSVRATMESQFKKGKIDRVGVGREYVKRLIDSSKDKK